MESIKKPIFIVGCTNPGTKCLFHSLMGYHSLYGPYIEFVIFFVLILFKNLINLKRKLKYIVTFSNASICIFSGEFNEQR